MCGKHIRLLLVLVMIVISLSYSVVNLAILINYQIKSPSYWSFWIFNTLTFMFGLSVIIILKTVSAIRNSWIAQEFLMNLTMFFISLANIFCFLLSFIHFVFNFARYGFWVQEGPLGGTHTVFNLTFATFLVNLAPYLAILFMSRKAHLHHRAKVVGRTVDSSCSGETSAVV